jgi:hypothetical protein
MSVIKGERLLKTRPKRIKPNPIFRGNPTIRMFNCGTVRATIPKHRFDRKRAIMIGAAILMPITNISLLTLITISAKTGFRVNPDGGTT